MTLTVLGVAGWTVRFAADQLIQHAGSTAAGLATARVEQLMRSVRSATPAGSPVTQASTDSFRDASRYLHQRLTDELDVGLLRRGRPDAQWCAAFRRLVGDDAALATFLTEIDPPGTRRDADEESIVEESFHLSYLRWLDARELGDRPEVVAGWVLDGIPARSADGTPSMLYDHYLRSFDERYRTDAEVKAALDTIRHQALMAAIDELPDRTVEALRTSTELQAGRDLDDALSTHLRATIASNERLRLPLHDAEGRVVRIGVDELYLDLPLELPPGAEGPSAQDLLVPSTYAERVTSSRRTEVARSTSAEGEPAQLPPALSVATCLVHRPRLLLTGGPGSGKSSVVRFLAWRYAHLAAGTEAPLASAQAASLVEALPSLPWVPVVVRCKDLSGEELSGPLREVLAAQLSADAEVSVEHVPGLAQELTDRVRRGDALLLVDGLDECDAPARRALADLLEREGERHPALAAVVTSRHTGLSEVEGTLATTLDRYEIAALRPEHQELFLSEWEQLSERLRTTSDDADDLRSAVSGSRELTRLAEFIQPLTLIAQVHLRDGSIPRNRAKLYRRAVGDLLRSRSGDRHIDEVWPEMTHLAYRMHDSGAVVWEMDRAEAAVDQFLELAREHGLEAQLRAPLPDSGAQWLGDAVDLAILNQSGRTAPLDELDDDYGEDDGDGASGATRAGPLAARLEFCHLAFQEFCAAHALLSPHRVIARG